MDRLKECALAEIENLRDEYCEVAQYIFDHPELGFEEYKSSKRLQDYLTAHGFEVESGVAGMPTAFRAEKKNGEGPKVGFVCEYDALPEVGHACGHNIIGTSSATAAIAAATALKELKGSIVVYGSPCEEGRGAGKQVLYENGLMDDIDCAMMFHPGPMTILSEPTVAVSLHKYTFHGKTAFAKNAKDGRNALDAVVQFFNNANALRHCIEQGNSYNGIITNGGKTAGMIPDLCEAEFSLRGMTRPKLDEIVERLEDCAQAAAMATGCTCVSEEVGRTYDDIWPSRVLVDVLEGNMKEIGLPIDVKISQNAFAATDMGNVSQHIPSIHSIYKLGYTAGQHSKEFADACTGENSYRMTREIAQALAMTAVELLENPEKLVEARKELDNRTGY